MLTATTPAAWPTRSELHQALIEQGFAVSPAELAAETYGASTRAAVEAYQRAHGLQVDGIAGPRTWASMRSGAPAGIPRGWRADTESARAAVREVIRVAVAELGQREEPLGSNRGRRVDLYTGMQGKPPELSGPAWCAYFCSWVYRASDPPSPFGRMGSVLGIYRWGEAHRRLVEEPQAGDLALVRRAGGRGHVGLVVSVLDDGRLCTVEGNSGNQVAARVRERGALPDLVRPVAA